MIRPQKEDQILISSITSINLQKITFSLHPSDRKGDAPLDDPRWTSIDDSICRLVDQLRASGLRHTLEVTFWMSFTVYGMEEYRNSLLLKLREKGQIRIMLVSDCRVFKWP